jgi:hypothetical protein
MFLKPRWLANHGPWLKQPVLPLLRFGYPHAHENLSYHLPAFYELWGGGISGLTHHNQALDRHFWLDAAQESLAFFNRMMHPITGLNPDYSEFSGVAKGSSARMMTFAMAHGAPQ